MMADLENNRRKQKLIHSCGRAKKAAFLRALTFRKDLGARWRQAWCLTSCRVVGI